MAAGREVEAHEGVARLQQRQEHRLVRLAAGIRLHVGEAAAEQLLGALDRQRLGDVDELAAAVIAPARIALGVFVGQHRALRLEHGAADDVLGGDQLDLVAAGGRVRCSIASAISGSASASEAVKNGRGCGRRSCRRRSRGRLAQYLHRRNLLARGAAGHVWRSKAALAGYHIRRRRPSGCGTWLIFMQYMVGSANQLVLLSLRWARVASSGIFPAHSHETRHPRKQ